MSVTIRLARVGKKNAPSYKIVVSNTRDKRNGRYLDILGYYNPTKNPPEYKLDEKKYDEWKQKGAMSTEAVEKLRDGTYEYKPYNGSKETGKGDNEKKTDQAAEAEKTESAKPKEISDDKESDKEESEE